MSAPEPTPELPAEPRPDALASASYYLSDLVAAYDARRPADAEAAVSASLGEQVTKVLVHLAARLGGGAPLVGELKRARDDATASTRYYRHGVVVFGDPWRTPLGGLCDDFSLPVVPSERASGSVRLRRDDPYLGAREAVFKLRDLTHLLGGKHALWQRIE